MIYLTLEIFFEEIGSTEVGNIAWGAQELMSLIIP